MRCDAGLVNAVKELLLHAGLVETIWCLCTWLGYGTCLCRIKVSSTAGAMYGLPSHALRGAWHVARWPTGRRIVPHGCVWVACLRVCALPAFTL